MPDPAPLDDAAPGARPGFVARNNEVLGSVLGLLALAASIALGAVLMLSTGARGIAAIATLVLIAGGTFTLLYLLLGALLRAATPAELWEAAEVAWRDSMGLSEPTAEDEAHSRRQRGLVVLGACLALALGLAISVLPAVL